MNVAEQLCPDCRRIQPKYHCFKFGDTICTDCRLKERTLLLRKQAEAELHKPHSNLDPLLGWADASVELELLGG